MKEPPSAASLLPQGGGTMSKCHGQSHKFSRQNIQTSVSINMLFRGENTSAVVSFEVGITFKFLFRTLSTT